MSGKKAFNRFHVLLRQHLGAIESGGVAGSGSNLFRLTAEYEESFLSCSGRFVFVCLVSGVHNWWILNWQLVQILQILQE